MKERPILFSGPMVKAILEGRKTQTRRPVKPQPEYRENASLPGHYGTFSSGGWNIDNPIGMKSFIEKCPYGQPGDRLWVRETFTLETNFNLDTCDPPFMDGRPIRWEESSEYGRWWEQPHYRATEPEPQLVHEDCNRCDENGYCSMWKPSIHMPRWASRLTLEITNVRVERLVEISEEGAKAEGAIVDEDCIKSGGNYRTRCAGSWDSIYAAKGFGWKNNPWVWVVGFRRV